MAEYGLLLADHLHCRGLRGPGGQQEDNLPPVGQAGGNGGHTLPSFQRLMLFEGQDHV